MKVSPPVLLFAIIIGVLGGDLYGGIQSHNASVNSSPQSIFMAIVMGVFAVWFPRKSREDFPERPVGLWRRFWALQIDLFVVVYLTIGVSILSILLIEFFATGHWQWSYVRDERETRDVFDTVAIYLCFFGFYYYFYKHAALGRSTPGQYIFSYRIVPAESGVPQFRARVFYAGLGLWFSIFNLFFTRKNKTGIYFWDEDSNTRAIAIK